MLTRFNFHRKGGTRMLNFTIHTTTEVVFGRDIEEQIGPKLKEIGAHRILVHFGGSSARSSGLLDRKSTRLNSSHTSKSRMPSSA